MVSVVVEGRGLMVQGTDSGEPGLKLEELKVKRSSAAGFHGDIHTEVEANFVQFRSDFLEGRLAEVSDVQELVFAACHQMPDRSDALAFEAIRGADGKLELGQTHVEFSLQLGVDGHVLRPVAGEGFGGKSGTGLVVLHERVQVLAQDLGRLDQ